MANSNLTEAQRAKNDEFYTQYADIEKEISAYLDYNPDVFRGKTLLLPCDDPNRLVIYPDGNKAHIVALSFEVEVLDGQPGLSNETTAFGFFSLQEAAQMDIISNHHERILDALKAERVPFVK
jgi:hypothetical protein